MANQHISEPPASPRARGAQISAGVEALILDCLSKDPRERPDAAHLRDGLFQDGAVEAGAAQAGLAAGSAGSSRPMGTASAAQASGPGAFRQRPADRDSSPRPPERTISIPRRTFRAGSRQRTMLAVLVAALLLLLFAFAGAWALFGQGEQGGGTPGQNAGPGKQDKAAGPQNAEEKPENGAEDPAQGNSGGAGTQDGSQEENQAPAPPLAAAEEVVGDLYYQESFRRVDATWALLSGRLQNEIGSPERWAEREDLYTFTYMEFTALPSARAEGDTAEVTFEVRLDHTWGSETLSGTWVCVNEGGEWKLDRLENARTVPA